MGDDGNGTVIRPRLFGLERRRQEFEDEMIKRAKAAGIERSSASQFEAATYDIVKFYAYAMKQAKVTGDPTSSPRAHRDPRRAARNEGFPALEGPISFGSNGDALKPSTSSRCRVAAGS